MTSPVNYVDPTGHWFAPPELIDGDHTLPRYNDPRVVPEPEPRPALDSSDSACFCDTGTCGNSEFENDVNYNFLIKERNSILIEANEYYENMLEWLDKQDVTKQKLDRLEELYFQRTTAEVVTDTITITFAVEMYFVTRPDAIVSAVDAYNNLGGEISYNRWLDWYYGAEADWSERKYNDKMWWYRYYGKRIENYEKRNGNSNG